MILREEELLEICPVGHLNRFQGHVGLARAKVWTGTPHYNIPDAISNLWLAVSDTHGSARDRLKTVFRLLPNIGNLAVADDERQVCLRVYREIIKLLPRVTYFGLDASAKLDALSACEALGGGLLGILSLQPLIMPSQLSYLKKHALYSGHKHLICAHR